MRPRFAIGLAAVVLTASFAGVVVDVGAQRADAFAESLDHPAIAYIDGALDNRVEALNRRLASGEQRFEFDPVRGYLPAALDALGLPVESQVLVFSETSFQADQIHAANPRALYFDASAYVGWVPGADVLEVAVQDSRQGAVFYELAQDAGGTPQFRRNQQCLQCHVSWDTFAIPGLLMHSTAPLASETAYATGFPTDQRSPFVQRWGGWYVTGDHGGAPHMGNVAVTPADRARLALEAPQAPLASVEGLFDTAGYPSAHSDLVALLVLAHQTYATNLMTRTGWEARVAEAAGATMPTERVHAAARDLVDYLLFVDEAPLPAPVAGSSPFAEVFAAEGPRDARGRSLRDLDLETRLLAHRFSYMVYAPAFDALPVTARDAVYRRLWDVLAGEAGGDARYAGIEADERQAIVEILRDTRDGLPEYFFDPLG